MIHMKLQKTIRICAYGIIIASILMRIHSLSYILPNSLGQRDAIISEFFISFYQFLPAIPWCIVLYQMKWWRKTYPFRLNMLFIVYTSLYALAIYNTFIATDALAAWLPFIMVFWFAIGISLLFLVIWEKQ